MAFEQLGFSMVVQGAAQFARDIGYLNSAIIRYQRSMDSLETKLLSLATAEERVAQRRVNAAQRVYAATYSYLVKQEQLFDAAAIKVEIAQGKINQVIATGGTVSPAQKNSLTKAVNEAITAYLELMDAQVQYEGVSKALIQLNGDLADSHQKTADILLKFGDNALNLSTIFSTLSGGFAKSIASGTGVGALLMKLTPQTAALSLVLDAAKIGLDAFSFALKAVLGVIQFGWSILSKFLSIIGQIAGALLRVAWNAAVNGFKAVFNAVKDIVTLPLRVAQNFFQSLGNALQNIVQIAIGMNLERILWGIGQRIRELAGEVYTAAVNFQLMEIRLRGLIQRELSETQGISFADSLEVATQRAEDLSYWISQLAVKSIFNASTIANAVTLAMSYDYTEQEAKNLTVAIIKFATGMGLGNDEMTKIIENMGQMRAAGKMTGTELRDLARGAFVPYNEIFKIMAKMPEVVAAYGDSIKKVSPTELDWVELKKAGAAGQVDVNLFMKGFIEMVNKDFPNAIENASSSMEIAQSNIKDFFDSVIGWRVLKPVIDVISKSISDFVATLNALPNQVRFARIGELLARIFEKVQQLIEGKSGQKWADIITNLLDKIILFLDMIDNMLHGLFANAAGDAFVLAGGYGSVYDMLFNIIKWVKDNKDEIMAFLQDPAGYIKEHLLPALQDLGTKGFEFIKGKWEEAKNSITNWITDHGTETVDFFATKLLGGMSTFALFLEQKFGAGSPLVIILDILKQLTGIGADWVKNLIPNTPIFDEYGLFGGMSDTGQRFGLGGLGAIQKDIELLNQWLNTLVNDGLNKLDQFIGEKWPGWADFKVWWDGFTKDLETIGTNVSLLWTEHISKLFDSIGGLFNAPGMNVATHDFFTDLINLVNILILVTAQIVDFIKLMIDLLKIANAFANYQPAVLLIKAIIELIRAMNEGGSNLATPSGPTQPWIFDPTAWENSIQSWGTAVTSAVDRVNGTLTVKIDNIIGNINRVKAALLELKNESDNVQTASTGPEPVNPTVSSVNLINATNPSIPYYPTFGNGSTTNYNLSVQTIETTQTVVTTFDAMRLMGA